MSPIIVPVSLDFSESLIFASSAELDAQVAVTGSWSALTSFVVAGLAITTHTDNDLFYIYKYLGETNVPGDVRRLRRSVLELMRRMGQPVIVKHMLTDRDVRLGIAQKSPLALDAYGAQVRNHDPFSYGTGFCSVELSANEWIDPNSGHIVTADAQPAVGWAQAPKYRGYGPGYLTYLIEPDTPADIFKLTSSGVIAKVQSQTVVSAWFPEINDNDLVINVELDDDGRIADSHERYQAKRTTPISIRGRDRKGRREYSADHGNRHVVNQQFEMSAVPETSVLYAVETDR